MSVYGNTRGIYGGSSYLEDVDAVDMPDYLSIEECAMNIVVESEMNWNSLMRAVAVTELSCLEETGEELIYEASTGGGFLSKVKEFFVNLLAKVKGLFKKFFALIQSYTATDKDFVKKYRADLLKINTRDFSYKGYKFTNLDNVSSKLGDANKEMRDFIDTKIAAQKDITDAIYTSGNVVAVNDKGGGLLEPEKDATGKVTGYKNDVIKKIDDVIKIDEDTDDFDEELRGKAAKGAGVGDGKRTAKELEDDLFEYYRNGESSKEEIENVNVSQLLNDIDTTKSLRKNAEKQYKELTKAIDKDIKEIENIQKQYIKMIPDKEKIDSEEGRTVVSKLIRAINIYTGAMRKQSSILQVVNTAQLKALKDRNRQAKSVCVSLLNYKPKHEGFYYDDEDGYSSYSEGSNFVNNVVFK